MHKHDSLEVLNASDLATVVGGEDGPGRFEQVGETIGAYFGGTAGAALTGGPWGGAAGAMIGPAAGKFLGRTADYALTHPDVRRIIESAPQGA